MTVESEKPRETLQLVQEARGYMHACGAYVNGKLVHSWSEHPQNGEALRELLDLAEGREVAPLAFVPRKFSERKLGKSLCRCDHWAGGEWFDCCCDPVWPVDLDALKDDLVEVPRSADDEGGWPLGAYPVDLLAQGRRCLT